jgi:hypothetical protein
MMTSVFDSEKLKKYQKTRMNYNKYQEMMKYTYKKNQFKLIKLLTYERNRL